MIRAEQIPDAVARLADEVYYDTAGSHPTMSDEDIMKHAIAAAINAWPGMLGHGDLAPSENGPPLHIEQAIILPLPQEVKDDPV